VTNALNGVARALAAEESELIVVCSPLEHQANFLSWQNIAREVRILGWGERGLDLEQAAGVMRGARVLAITAASNVTGESLPMRELVEMAHSMGMRVVIDAAQFTAHAFLPADGWGADIIVTSGHKMYGPVGLGVTFMSESVQALRPSVWGGGMGEADGWEAGTWSAHEAQMLAWAWEFATVGVDEGAWRAVEVVKKWAGERMVKPRGLAVGPLVSYVPSGHPHDVAAKLGELGVMVRAGQLCAPQAMQAYGVRETGVVRFSFGAMTNEDDCERLAEVLESNQDLL
jgi:cysteine desulfurase/selenocysteine lyase